jgi:uncharacterized SAM-binding protein YcdF (DUF218 family)
VWCGCLDELAGKAAESSRFLVKGAGINKRKRTLLILAGLALAWPFLAWGMAQLLIVQEPFPTADAIVVLSGSSAIRERTRVAAELYGQVHPKMVLLTNDNQKGGWSPTQQRNPYFHEQAQDALHRLGVPAEQIELLPQPVSSTYDELRLVSAYAAARGLHSVLMVTSAYHSRRAWWTARRVFQGSGITVGLVAAPPGWESPSPWCWWLSPRGWCMVPGEYVKIGYYRVRYH